MTLFEVAPVTLEGKTVRLEPLEPRHAADLFAAGADEELWRFMTRPALKSAADAEAYIVSACRQDLGAQVPFAIVDRARGRAIGSTRYFDVRPRDRAVEIGHTWIAATSQGTGVNVECKLLLFGHAFETLGAIRVQLKTDLRNVRSQRAMERVGCTREGVLRRHMTLWDGHVRDTVYFSVIAEEWPAVKSRLIAIVESSK